MGYYDKIKLSAELYERLLGKGQTLPRALQLSLREALKSGYNAASPPLSLATPALFGQQAVELILKPPQAPKREFKMPTIGLAYFPPEPIRFVGRSGPLGRASSALAPESDKNGVLFHGMAGAGKTACALELAYHHSRSHRFQGFVWYKAPDEGRDIDRALLHLAIDMEAQLPGFKMVHVVDDLEAFKNFMPLLKQFVIDNSILIVLDSLESLLTQEGNRRDERWKLLIETLIQHDGYSRVILTSRRIPEDLNTEHLILEPIHALSLSETLVLAREMPNLGRMLLGQDTIGLDKGRELVMRTLSIVQGHPKLIEMADARAGDPGALEGSLEKAAQAWGSKSRLESFFEEERSSQDSEKFLDVLKGWAQDLSETLPEASRAFFHVLCALEETDRENQILEQVWPNLWKQLGLAGQAQSIEANLGNLNALVKVQSLKNGSKYIVHPSIAEAGLEEVENGFRKRVDEEMARFLSAFFEAAKGKEMEGMGKLIVRAGLSATPYLMRLNRWSEATELLQEATKRDSSPNTIASALIILRRIIEATTGTDAEQKNSRFLARLLIESNRRRDAENILRPLIANCVKSGELVLARAAATDLFIILRDSRPREALELAEKIIDCTIKLGLGPWTQIEAKGLRLQALNKLGRYPETLKVVMDLRAQMDALPELSEQDEVVEEWNVKEVILSTAQEAAINSGSPDQILDLTAELFEIRKARGAPELEIARGVFGNYSGLIRLGKYDAAEKLLLFCRDIFEKEKDVPDLVKVFGALSIVMDVENQPKRAVDYGETALRYAYLANSVEDISIMHNNLGNYFSKAGLNRGLSHHLAEGILSYLGDKGIMKSSLRHISIDLSQFGSMVIPTSFDQLCQIVEEVDGVLFRDLFYRLAGSDANGDQVMQEVLRMAQESI